MMILWFMRWRMRRLMEKYERLRARQLELKLRRIEVVRAAEFVNVDVAELLSKMDETNALLEKRLREWKRYLNARRRDIEYVESYKRSLGTSFQID